MPILCLLLFLLCFGALNVQGEEINVTRIYTTNEFIAFLKSKEEYTGTTVYLESDMDFSGGLSGEFTTKSDFYGTFDGQGHVVRNLVARSSSGHAGLFFLVSGTIQNVVIDSSCSFTNNCTEGGNVYVGAVVGYLYTKAGSCLISNIVNMADVSFEGDTSYLFIGGITSCVYFPSTNYDATVKNCVNYGTVKYSGEASSEMLMGGIVGYSVRSSSNVFIYNCLNYGEVINNGTTPSSLRIGGIIGHNIYPFTTLVNCVSAGKITSASGKIGSIAGYSQYGTTNITHCLWTADVGYTPTYSGGSVPLINSSLVTFNSTTASELNEYAESNGWSRWLFNANNASVSFVLNNREIASLSSQLILLPDFVPEGDDVEFDGWYSDPYYTEPFQSPEVTGSTTLYGLHGVVVTVTFDMNGGDSISHTSKRVTYNNAYGTLPAASRTGYIFTWWSPDRNEVVTSGTTVTTAADHTLTARWEEVTESMVEIVFGTKDLSEDEAKGIIKQYTEDEFTIIAYEKSDESNEIKVIVKFTGNEDAKEFVRNVNENMRDGGFIRTVGLVQSNEGSFSNTLFNPSLVFLFNFILI